MRYQGKRARLYRDCARAASIAVESAFAEVADAFGDSRESYLGRHCLHSSEVTRRLLRRHGIRRPAVRVGSVLAVLGRDAGSDLAFVRETDLPPNPTPQDVMAGEWHSWVEHDGFLIDPNVWDMQKQIVDVTRPIGRYSVSEPFDRVYLVRRISALEREGSRYSPDADCDVLRKSMLASGPNADIIDASYAYAIHCLDHYSSRVPDDSTHRMLDMVDEVAIAREDAYSDLSGRVQIALDLASGISH